MLPALAPKLNTDGAVTPRGVRGSVPCAGGDGERGGEATNEGNPDHAREEGFG
jgi:hypothetical protein